ncbi:MAG: UDP-3-O-(3-hydroxymyristoyl)glucosamine N-acyltransferase [Endomicrobium sp.]|jgi:UDP-3-O-[3-hydroxymyristoyl] glucosamine N-acyltransferase|nr:UDP-3-O-(3-hydroxymyristoyl)glucosamine N-acyltransferase [Endomicrobium sp.]
MRFTAFELAAVVSGELIGDKDVVLTGVNGLLEAKNNEVSFLENLKYLHDALNTQAGVILVGLNTDVVQFKNKNIIKVKNPKYAYSMVLSIIEKGRLSLINKKIHRSAAISDKVKIGKDPYIGQNVVIECGAEIGDNAKIFPNVYIGRDVKIGKDCLIYPNVVIRENSLIGDRVVLQPGVVIGGDGFGFVSVDGKTQKIPQIGRVEIGNDVEIGSNTTIDRATVDATRIGNGAKIDNLVMIAHNVQVGENCIIVSQVGISGSTHLGNNVTIGGQTGIAGHIKIGDNVMISGQSGISGNVKDGDVVGGNPMSSLNQSIKIRVLMRKLPEMYSDLRKIKKDLEDK